MLDKTLVRSLLMAMALVPPIVGYLVQPIRGGALPFSAPMASTASFAAFVAAFLPSPRSRTRRTPPARLLASSTLRRPPGALPAADAQATAITKALAVANTPTGIAPPSRAEAIASALRSCRTAWNTNHLAPTNLPEAQRLTLYLLLRLLTGDAAEAGHFAQYFQRPAAILALRDEIDLMDATRRRFDAGTAVFRATENLHRAQIDVPSFGMRAALVRLGTADIDLWHHVIATHNPASRAQSDAALWCAGHTDCDRASVALYLARTARAGHLIEACDVGDTAFLSAILGIITRWNAGAYTTAELGLDPEDSLVPDSEAFAAALDYIALNTDGDRWAEPREAFVPHIGRAPRPRPAWDLASGQLHTAPRRSDYIDPID